MGFDALIVKVQQAEAALESRERRTGEHWRQWKAIWNATKACWYISTAR